MPRSLTITTEWESMDGGSPEECACFAALEIQANGVCLTEGRDQLVNRLRRAPLLSAYHLAEWFAWNWWRLRWEPRPSYKAEDWAFAHQLPSIGGGYIWPNITIFSDDQRIALVAKLTEERAETPFRYINNSAAFIPAAEFEGGVDDFVEQVLQRLQSVFIADSNLERIWNSVKEERSTPELAYRRKLEALLGKDPDEYDESLLSQLIKDAGQLGSSAVEELAAGHEVNGRILTANELEEVATRYGVQASTRELVNLSPSVNPSTDNTPAWKIGYEFAQALRVQEKLDADPIKDERLIEMLGVSQKVFDSNSAPSSLGLSFELNNKANENRIVLCPNKRKTRQRFDVARILGDRLINSSVGRLFPATRAYTSRQQAQRAFAAELLSPFSQVVAMLRDDYSQDNQSDIAEYFGVSPLTIRTMLVNHRKLDRDDPDYDYLIAA